MSDAPRNDSTVTAPGAAAPSPGDGPGAEAEVAEQPRMYDGAAVGKIVADRVSRLNKVHEAKLSAVAEKAAVAAIARVREQADAELGELLSDLDMTPADLLAVRRARRAQELRRQPPDQRHPSTWDAADVERMKRDGTFGNAVAAWKGK